MGKDAYHNKPCDETIFSDSGLKGDYLETTHSFFSKSSQSLSEIESGSVDLVLTSPPYPMIEMWDELFFQINPEIRECFEKKEFFEAFTLMHRELNKTWAESARVLKDGGILCVNIGDATRTLDKEFQLWSNHTMINHNCIWYLNLKPLPVIIWRKSGNKPNKFMGSGMLPPNAYVTFEHEYILVFRKKGKRVFGDDSARRYESAYFWEERNEWFSDVWFDIKGIKQNLDSGNRDLRDRSAAFPLELALRLINMFSLREDLVLDPFWGTGTTSLAAMLCGRSSAGYELSPEFHCVFTGYLKNIRELSRKINRQRIERHREFISRRPQISEHANHNYDMRVITGQEEKIRLFDIDELYEAGKNRLRVEYSEFKS